MKLYGQWLKDIMIKDPHTVTFITSLLISKNLDTIIDSCWRSHCSRFGVDGHLGCHIKIRGNQYYLYGSGLLKSLNIRHSFHYLSSFRYNIISATSSELLCRRFRY